MVYALDYIYEAMPSHPQRLRKVERALDRILTCALRVPRNMPHALLWTSLNRGGFGVPHLYTRMCLRHVRGFLRAMDSRSVLVRENLCAPWSSRAWQGRDGLNLELLVHILREVGMDMLVLPAARATLVDRTVEVCRMYTGGHVLLVADGAMVVTLEGDHQGYSGLVADGCGVLATVHSGASTVSSHPWAAEWAGNLDEWDLAASPGVPPSVV